MGWGWKRVESPVLHLTLTRQHERNVFLVALPADAKPYEGGGWRCNAVRECDKITAVAMERGRKAYEAITDNQTRTEPSKREEIKGNGEGGEENSRNRTVWCKWGKKRNRECNSVWLDFFFTRCLISYLLGALPVSSPPWTDVTNHTIHVCFKCIFLSWTFWPFFT